MATEGGMSMKDTLKQVVIGAAGSILTLILVDNMVTQVDTDTS